MYELNKCVAVILLFCGFVVFAQDYGTIQYSMERFEQYTNPRIVKHDKEGNLKEKFRLDSIAMAEFDGTKNYFTLDFDTESVHFYINDLDYYLLQLIQLNITTSTRNFYKNRVEDKNFILHDFSEGNPHLVESDIFSNREWTITEETKEIKGYTCKKAVLIEEFESDYPTYVWFTEEIDLNYGLLSLNGLPGVVLGLETNHVYIFANEIDFENKPNIKWPELQKLNYEDHILMMGYKFD